jgi:two-component system phosphate regulon sensor histidine kinase PhoR
MNRNCDMATVLSPRPDPVARISGFIGDGAGLPDPADLARHILDTWLDMPGVRAVALGASPAVASLCDSAFRGQREAWLVGVRDADPTWLTRSENGPGFVPTWSGAGGQVMAGAGDPPGGALWPSLEDGTDDRSPGWLAAPVSVRGATGLVLVVGLDSEPGEHPEVKDSLTRLQAVMAPVTAVWYQALELDARLRRVDEENRSLVRLNRLQGRFVAMASHEFKAPLTSITAYTDVLREKLQDSEFPQAGEFLEVIGAETDRLLRMVNRILDFTRLEHGAQLLALKPVNLEPLVHEALRSLNPIILDKDLTLEVMAPVGLPRVAADPDLIRQVLINLLHNAVKFTPKAGRITVKIQEEEAALAVSVLDDGPGIPAEDIRRIFREFYRAENGSAAEEGAGLGLTIARHIVNLHGGHIEVARRPEGGSDFRILLPKEMGSLAPLAEVLRRPVDSEEGARLVENLLFLLAEMTGSRAVVMLLRDGRGALVPVGALGLDLDATRPLPLIENAGWTRFLERGEAVTDPGALAGDLGWCPQAAENPDGRMYAPVGTGEAALGVVILGRRRGLESYGRSDLVQLSVLMDIVRAALAGIDDDLGPVTAALRLLLRVRRNRVPTTTAGALALMGKLGERLKLGPVDTRRLQLAAVLHDAGMAQVEDEIVLGESDLTLDERDEVNRHVEQAVELLGPLMPDGKVADIIRHHHERYDGKGYPDGLAGREIPLGSRMMAVLDTWFSLTSPRPFRRGISAPEARAEIAAHAGTQFDERIVQDFFLLLEDEGLLEPSGPSGTTNAPVREEIK